MNQDSVRHDDAYVQEEFSLLDLLVFLARYKKIIVAFALAAMMLMLVWTLLRQDEYSATARLLPPQQLQFSSAALASALEVRPNGSGIAGGKGSADLYVDVLQSNKVMDALIARFDLKKVYETESQEMTRHVLQTRTTIASGKDGFIAITVKDTGRERVTALVNAYISELNRLMQRAVVNAAGQQQAFLERELTAAQANVALAERALQEGMAQHGMRSPVANVETIARTIAVLRAQISEQQINLNASDSFLSASNPSYLRAREELDSLKLQLDRLSEGSGIPDSVATGQKGAVTTAQLVRNLEVARRAFESISVQHDLAKMDRSEAVMTIQVLDEAVAPDSPLSTESVENVLLTGLAAAILAIAACFIAEAIRVAKAQKRHVRAADNFFS